MGHFNKKTVLTACLVFAVLLVGLTSFGMVEAANKKVSIGRKKLELYVNQSYKMKNNKYTWKSSNKKVLVVNKNGKVKAKKAGLCKVTASKKIGKKIKKAVCSVKVGNYAARIDLRSADTIILGIGQTKDINAKVMPNTVLYKNMTYSSGNNAIASVSKTGKITAVAPGITNVSIVSKAVNSKKKKVTASVTVIVTDNDKPIEVPNVLPGEDVGKTTSGWEVILPTEEPHTPTPTPSYMPTKLPLPGETAYPEPTKSPTATPTKAPMTVKEYVQSLKPTGTSALVGSFLAKDSATGAVRTLYLLDRSYTGNVQLKIDDFSFSHTGNVDNLLNRLETEYISVTQNDITLRRLKKDKTEFWTVTFLQTGAVYQFIGRKNDVTSANYIDDYAPYGIIIALGNTLDNIKIY